MCWENYSGCLYYCPHPKDGEGNIFSLFVSSDTSTGPMSFLGGTPVTAPMSLSGSYPIPGWGVPQDGVPPARDGVLPARSGRVWGGGTQGRVPPARDGVGQQMEYLICDGSRRRTFLF